MPSNTIGELFKLTTFGESHGPGLGGVIDGCPSRIPLQEEDIQTELDKRRPGKNKSSTPRQETDQVQLLSGIFEGQTTGTSIGFFIPNNNPQPKDYSQLKDIYRPGHADYTYDAKYGIRDYRGGGRSSGRETVSRVVGGAVAQKFLSCHNIQAFAYTKEISGIQAELIEPKNAQKYPYFAPDPSVVQLWDRKIDKTKKKGDSVGGTVEIQVHGVPPGLGEPVFDKLDAKLAYALMGVGAIKSVEVGSGLEAAELPGSQHNDPITPDGFKQNNAGGVMGGISSGQPIIVRATVKPIPSIYIEQQTITKDGEETSLQIQGRHDVCAIPRIVPVLKAMVNLVIADMWLLQSARQSG